MCKECSTRANHFGEKLHLDQNEKLVMYGVTHVVAVLWYSRKIVHFITIPKENSIVIYIIVRRRDQGIYAI